MSKHTPGPWKAGQREITASVAGESRIVAFLPEAYHCAHPDDVKPNARLIAAAPDMLALLRELTADCRKDVPESFDGLKLRALEIVSKVEG